MSLALRRGLAALFAAGLALGGVACSDEDNDGATTDEEVGELEDTAEDAGERIEEEVDAGEEEVQDDGNE